MLRLSIPLPEEQAHLESAALSLSLFPHSTQTLSQQILTCLMVQLALWLIASFQQDSSHPGT